MCSAVATQSLCTRQNPCPGGGPSYCTDTATGKVIVYYGSLPAGCTPLTDACPDNASLGANNPTLGYQSTVPFQSGGIWYGVAGNPGVCIPDACPDNKSLGLNNNPTLGFQAIVPFTVNGVTYNIGADGLCEPTTVNPGGPGSTTPINPIYKEN